MPRYDLTVNDPAAGEGTLVEVPPVGAVANGETLSNVFLHEETAEFLATSPAIELKKLPSLKVEEVVKAAENAKDFDTLNELAAGEERDGAVRAITNARVALAEKEASEPMEVEAVEVEAATTGVPLAGSGQVTEPPQEGATEGGES